jgi:hypothetical protein
MSFKDFALYLDPPAGSAGAGNFRRVVPLADSNTGQISIVFDDFGTPLPNPGVTVAVRINGTPLPSPLHITATGKTVVHKLHNGDTQASFDVTPPPGTGGTVIHPSLAVLVEYN